MNDKNEVKNRLKVIFEQNLPWLKVSLLSANRAHSRFYHFPNCPCPLVQRTEE